VGLKPGAKRSTGFRQESFTESEIRPDDLMAGQQARFHADVERLLRHKTSFVAVDCPACGGDQATGTFEKMGFSYVTCDACATLFMSPRPAPDHLREYYETSENYRYWAEHIFPASESVRRERIFKPRVARVLELCERAGVGRSRLLEVGAGFGIFCEELEATGVFDSVVAVEPTPDLAARCRARGLNVIESPIEDLVAEEFGQADVVASFETIEHLFSPADFVDACARMVGPEGLLVLSCPNGRGFDVVVLGPGSDTVDAEHLNYFNPESIRILVERSGFDVIELLTPGRLDAELVRKKALSGEWDSATSPFLDQVLIERWDALAEPFQDFLADNLLSSHMWVVARRR
jgi:2-polyprenyl-3-methyl-5-hydroxy-6-metoxy-1,4-benzoquinol methylase/ribosomal protein S27E